MAEARRVGEWTPHRQTVDQSFQRGERYSSAVLSGKAETKEEDGPREPQDDAENAGDAKENVVGYSALQYANRTGI